MCVCVYIYIYMCTYIYIYIFLRRPPITVIRFLTCICVFRLFAGPAFSFFVHVVPSPTPAFESYYQYVLIDWHKPVQTGTSRCNLCRVTLSRSKTAGRSSRRILETRARLMFPRNLPAILDLGNIDRYNLHRFVPACTGLYQPMFRVGVEIDLR